MKNIWNMLLADAVQHTFGQIDDEDIPFEITHFLGGPCEEEQVAACLILAEGKCILIQDKDCLRRGIATANSIHIDGLAALKDVGGAANGASWFKELPQLQAPDDGNEDNEENESSATAQVDEPAAKRQKQ